MYHGRFLVRLAHVCSPGGLSDFAPAYPKCLHLPPDARVLRKFPMTIGASGIGVVRLLLHRNCNMSRLLELTLFRGLGDSTWVAEIDVPSLVYRGCGRR